MSKRQTKFPQTAEVWRQQPLRVRRAVIWSVITLAAFIVIDAIAGEKASGAFVIILLLIGVFQMIFQRRRT